MWLKVMILLAGLCLFPMKSHALSCTATVTTVAFGTVDPFASASTTSGTLRFTCTKGLTEVLNAATVCFNLYPTSSGAPVDARKMASGSNQLSYQLYTDAGRTNVWGNQGVSSNSVLKYSLGLLDLGVAHTIPFYAAVPAGQATTAPGSYLDAFTTTNTTITAKSDPLVTDSSCGTTVVGNMAFNVTASVNKQCKINATNNITLDSVPHTRTNITGNNFFTMTCTNTTPYTVGLSPSNGNSAGSGVMKSATSPDQVPYQLNSTVGVSGTPWGSLAPNTVAGTGPGQAVDRYVYVVVPSANYRPATYNDTVTINVTY